MIALPNPMQGVVSVQAHYRASLWLLTRPDLEQLRFTTHNRPITFDDGSVGPQVFSPVGGFIASAHERASGLRDQNRTVEGAITSDEITAEDLAGGLYDGSELVEYVVDWRAPFAGALATRRFWIGDVVQTGERWEAQVSGLTSWLEHKTGRSFQRTCNADLGDARCKYAFPNAWDVITEASVLPGSQDADEPRRVFSVQSSDVPDSGPAEDEYRHGLVSWTTGANAGLESEVKAYTHTIVSSGRLIELHLPTPFDIADNDEFTLTTGCDRLLGTCRDKFDNVVNNRGFAFMPGTDDVVKTPSPL